MKVTSLLKDRLPVLITILSVILVLLFILKVSFKTDDKIYPLNDNWQYLIGDMKNHIYANPESIKDLPNWTTMENIQDYSLSKVFENLEPSSNLLVWFRKELSLPLDNNDNSMIFFKNIFAQSLEIYYDENIAYKKDRTWFPDTNTVFLPLPQSKNASFLYLKLQTPKEFLRIGISNNVLSGNSQNLWITFMQNNFIDIVSGFIIGILGLIIILCSLFLNKTNRKGWLPLGNVFLIIGTLWVLSSNFIEILYPQLELSLNTIEDLTKFALSIFTFLFFEQIFNTKKKSIVGILKYIQIGVFLTTVIILYLNFYTHFDGLSLYITLKSVVLPSLFIVQVIVLIIKSFSFAIKGNIFGKLFSLGITSLCIFGIIDIILISATPHHTMVFYKMGVVLFIFSLACIMGMQISANYNKVISYSKELEVKNTQLDSAWNEVKKASEKLSQLNKTLEVRILERTKELEHANEELTTVNEDLNNTNSQLVNTLDILKMTQDQLIESEKMAALGQLVAGIAHEINTPIGAIKSSVDNMEMSMDKYMGLMKEFPEVIENVDNSYYKILVDNISGNSYEFRTSKEERDLKKAIVTKLRENDIPNAEKKANMLMSMGVTDVEDYLELLRMPQGDTILEVFYILWGFKSSARIIKEATSRTSKVVFALKSYAHFDHLDQMVSSDIKEIIETVLTLYHNKIKNGVRVIRNYEDVPMIPCYPDELAQVWTNLISNALQAMDYSGTLTIGLYQNDKNILISITDTGKGIPEDLQSRIFNPFFTTKPQGEGSGLGLDIVRRIVEKHNGKIHFESIPGKTTFTVSIPIEVE